MSRAEEPALTSAIGTNGKTGYVKSTDLDKSPKTLAQVLALPTNAQGAYVMPARDIPLYTEDGKTVIGTFHMGSDPASRSNPVQALCRSLMDRTSAS